MDDTSQKPSSKGKYFAKVTQPLPEAAIHGLFRFTSEKQAIERLQDFRDTFHLSKEQPAAPSIRLWIADYAVEQDEIKKGYCGHYAIISVKKLDSGKYTLRAEKDLAPVTTHPHKKFPTLKHPGWSHPIMRAIKRGKVFGTQAIANEVLEQLHSEYPETSVPGLGKLHLIVYEGTKEKGVSPVQKYILTVKAKGKGFVIAPEKNLQESAPKHIPKEKKGYFTEQVEEKRKKKKRSDPRIKKAPKIPPQKRDKPEA